MAMGQELTLRPSAKGSGTQSGSTIMPPHACTLSKRHPCLYYGGDPNLDDPESTAVANENTLYVPHTYTYAEVNVPVDTSISASFSDIATAYPVFDPKVATWFYRTGVSEGNGGTLICSGDNPAMFTREYYGTVTVLDYEVLTTTPCRLPAGNVWFAVTPNCTNPNDVYCTKAYDPAYWEWNTDGTLNAINYKFTVTSNNGMGPTLDSQYFGYTFTSWCNAFGLVCGEGMSAGVLK